MMMRMMERMMEVLRGRWRGIRVMRRMKGRIIIRGLQRWGVGGKRSAKVNLSGDFGDRRRVFLMIYLRFVEVVYKWRVHLTKR